MDGPLFTECEYVGADIAEGPGVDLVRSGQALDFPTESFDVVLSCECFEHNPFWLETFSNMLRMLKPGGICFFTCASTGRSEHGTSRMGASASLTTEHEVFPDYYKNLQAKELADRIPLKRHFGSHFFHENIYRKDLYFCGVKRGPTIYTADESINRLHTLAKSIRLQNITPAGIGFAILKQICKRTITAVSSEKQLHNIEYLSKRVQRGLRSTMSSTR